MRITISGKNIELVQQLIKDLKDEAQINIGYDEPIYKEQLKAVLGHKFTEVVGGFVVGIIVPLLICPLFLR